MVPTLWDTPCVTTPFWREQSFGPQPESAPNMMWIQEVWDGAQEHAFWVPGSADDGVQGSHIWENELEEGRNLWSARIFLTVGI